MEFLSEYGLFLLKTATIVIALIFILGAMVRAFARGRGRDPEGEGRLLVRKLNRRFEELADAIRREALPRKAFRAEVKQRNRARRKADKSRTAAIVAADPAGKKAPALTERPAVYVLDFKGDVRASGVQSLREEVNAVLSVAAPESEVLLRLDSPGGVVHGYGLAASQLERVRERGLKLTVAVDKIAASGGYLMAAVADRILAAPFAVVGSIGVVAAMPNFRRLLARHDIDVEHHTAGQYKRTLSMVGENTDEGRAKFREDLAEVHELFKDFVARYRPGVDIEKVATGEAFWGKRAVELGLVDELRTSDDYLIERSGDSDLLAVRWLVHRGLGQRIADTIRHSARGTVRGVVDAGMDVM